MEKYEVSFEGGESRYTTKAVNHNAFLADLMQDNEKEKAFKAAKAAE